MSASPELTRRQQRKNAKGKGRGKGKEFTSSSPDELSTDYVKRIIIKFNTNRALSKCGPIKLQKALMRLFLNPKQWDQLESEILAREEFMKEFPLNYLVERPKINDLNITNILNIAKRYDEECAEYNNKGLERTRPHRGIIIPVAILHKVDSNSNYHHRFTLVGSHGKWLMLNTYLKPNLKLFNPICAIPIEIKEFCAILEEFLNFGVWNDISSRLYAKITGFSNPDFNPRPDLNGEVLTPELYYKLITIK